MFFANSLNAQNVGIGTTTPEALLEIKRPQLSNVLISSNSFSDTTRLTFRNMTSSGSGTEFIIGLNRETGLRFSSKSDLSINNYDPILFLQSSGRVGINTASPSEALEVNGNIELQSSLKGIVLNAAERPLISRRYDPFTSGIYNGVGRWGVYMEPSRLTLGIPKIPGKAIQFVTYNLNSNIEDVLLSVNENKTVNIDGPLTNSGKTGSANLLPIAFGSINGSTGAILKSTGNFTVVRTSTGAYTIEINGETYLNTTHIVVISPYGPSPRMTTIHRNTAFTSTGFRAFTSNYDGFSADTDFSIVVYKP